MNQLRISLSELLGLVVAFAVVMPLWPSSWGVASHLYFAVWLVANWVYGLTVWRKWKSEQFQNISSEEDVLNLGVPPIVGFIAILAVIRFELFSVFVALALWIGIWLFPLLFMFSVIRLVTTLLIRHDSAGTNALVAAIYLLCMCSIFFWRS